MSVRAECKARFDPNGDLPCILITGPVPRYEECKDWCPLLNRAIEDEDCVDGRNP